MVSLGINIGIPNGLGAVGGRPTWVPSGANWYAEYAPNERGYIDMTTYNSLASLLASSNASFARTASGLYLPTSGAYTSFAPGAVRIGDKGLLIEPAVTNRFGHNTFSDALLQSTSQSLGGVVDIDGSTGSLTAEVVAVGADNGLPYLDWRIHGTNDTGGTAFLDIYDKTEYAASPGDTFTNSMCMSLVAGTLTNVDIRLYEHYRNAANALLSSTSLDIVPTSSFACYSNTTTAPANTAKVINKGVYVRVANGNAVDLTLRLSGAQYETGGEVHTPIVTSGGEETRDADVFMLFPDAGTYDITITFDDDSTQVLSSQVITGSGWQIPTNLNRRYIKDIAGAAA